LAYFAEHIFDLRGPLEKSQVYEIVKICGLIASWMSSVPGGRCQVKSPIPPGIRYPL